MRKKNASMMDGPGQDSFLDIVANLVGILIILVMVIGVRAKDAMLDASPPQEVMEKGPEIDVAGARAAASAVESDIHQIDAKIKRQTFDVEFRRAERERIQLLVQAAEERLSERSQKLNDRQRQEFQLKKEVIESQHELERLTGQIASLKSAKARVAVIDHLPTPMAKTVFGREMHVRLQGGKLMVIPWDRLVAELQKEAPRQVRRLADRNEITETLGPIGGFFMKYTLARKRHTVSTRVGVAVQQGIELDHFVLLPVEEGLGEGLQFALGEGSQFLRALRQHDPDSTTVTVWTYPDSYNEFRQLKETLYPIGFLLASRPLPEGFPIGGSPNGLRSAAQ